MRRLTAGSGGAIRRVAIISVEVMFKVEDELLVDSQGTRENAI
jgi:hypothetical protein